MSQVETLPATSAATASGIWTYGRNPVRQVRRLGPKPVVELARRGHQPLPRPRPDPLAATRPQSDRPALGVHARAAGDAGRRTGALQPHQSGLSPAEGVCGRNRRRGDEPTPACSARSRSPTSRWSSASTSRCRSTPAAWACSRATTSRAPAGWACRWWPSGCSTTRAISSSISTSTAGSTKSISTRRSRTCRWSRPWAPTASRSPCGSTPAPASCWPRSG